MWTKEDIVRHIRELGITKNDTLFVHSSMRSIGIVEGGAVTVIAALKEAVADGLLVMPAHTWETISAVRNFFDYRREPACTGILPDIFRKMPGVVRSLHPTHSVAAFGEMALWFVEGEENHTTPFAREGCMGKLMDLGGKVLFIGCNPARNTFLHAVEEWNKIPDRMTEDTVLYRILLRGGEEIKEQRYHELHADFCQNGDVSVHYGKIMPLFLQEGAARKGNVGDADCIVADCRKMYQLTSEYLKINPMLFNDYSALPEKN